MRATAPALALALTAGVLVTLPAQVAPAVESPGASRSVPLPATLTFTVGLNYDRESLHAAARRISTPGSGSYRAFMSLSDAAVRFGATPEQRDALRSWAKQRGMSVTFDATGLTARVTGSPTAWSKVYASQQILAEPGGPAPRLTSFYVGSEEAMDGRVPPSLRGIVRGVIPVSNVLGPAPRAAFDPPINNGSPFGPGASCMPAEIGGIPFDRLSYSPSQLHKPYGTSRLHAEGQRGQGSRVAIVALGQSYAPGVAEAAAKCFGYRAPKVKTVGGPGMPDAPVMTEGYAGIESNLDLQTVAAVLPAASRIHFVEAASGVSWNLAIIDGFTTAYERVDPDVITLSYGLCTPQMREMGDGKLRWMSDDVLALGAILGTSILVAAGDSGSSACLHTGGTQAGLTAGYPAASPWVTAVGGTRIVLGKGNKRVNELVWNDLQWNPAAGSQAGAGSGGPTPYRVPWYQARVSSHDRRVVPDVVAHASGFPGWPVAMTPEQFEDFFKIEVPPQFEWVMGPVGGTSAATPFTAANVALLAAKHGRLGMLNPWLYDIAAGGEYSKAFFDVTKGNNLVAPQAACCKATRGFDMASGIGAPEFNVLDGLVISPD